MRRLVAACVVAGGLLLAASDADAAQCEIATSPVVFGNYNVFLTAATDSLGSVVYTCNGGAHAIQILISAGASGAFASRKLFKAGEWLGYNLYRDASRNVVWGDGVGGTSFYTSTDVPNRTEVVVPVFGQVPAGQDVTAGAYADSVSVTINF